MVVHSPQREWFLLNKADILLPKEIGDLPDQRFRIFHEQTFDIEGAIMGLWHWLLLLLMIGVGASLGQYTVSNTVIVGGGVGGGAFFVISRHFKSFFGAGQVKAIRGTFTVGCWWYSTHERSKDFFFACFSLSSHSLILFFKLNDFSVNFHWYLFQLLWKLLSFLIHRLWILKLSRVVEALITTNFFYLASSKTISFTIKGLFFSRICSISQIYWFVDRIWLMNAGVQFFRK